VLDEILGVPTHALVVHAVVVLLPLAALGGVAVALAPPLRRRYGLLVALLTVVAVASVPVATQSGERLFARLSARFGPDDVAEAGLMQRHHDLAESLLPWTLVLLAGVLLAVAPPLLAARATGELVGVGAAAPTRPAKPAWRRPVALLAAAVTLTGAVMTVVLVVRIGHLGSEAAWERLDRPAASLGTPAG
jgi:hypothetical protein